MGYASAAAIRRDIAGLLKPPRRIPVSQAVEECMRVQGASGSWIPWDRTATPYMVEPLDVLNSREFDAEIFVGPARTGKTQALVDGWIAYDVKYDPSDFLLVQISREKAAEFSKKRVDRMFTHSPELHECLSPRFHDNNIHDKIFRAGNYLKLGWPAKTILASSDYRRVALTDYDRIPTNIDGEGEGFWLARKRTQVYMSRGMTLAESSPGFEITDFDWRPDPAYPHAAPPTKGILSLYNLGDRRVLYWQCPECQEYFPARFEYLRWPDRETDILAASEQVTCICPRCGVDEIPPSCKDDMIQTGRWPKEGQTVNRHGEYQGEGRRSRVASFWMEGPAAAFQSWSQLVYNYLAALQDFEKTGNQEKLKTTVNVDQGRPYQYRKAENARSHEALQERTEKLGERVVPEGVRALFGSVDVQGGKKRRFVVQVVGYGEHGERWLIDRFSLRKSERKDENGELRRIDPGGYIEDWNLLISHVISRKYPLADESGREMPVLLTAIDTGGEDGVTENAYQFYRALRRQSLHHKVMLVKGGSTRNAPRMRETFPDSSGRKDRHASSRGDIPLYLLNTNLIKDTISNAMERTEPGPNYCHWPDWLGEWFFEELTYEQRSPDGKWSKPGKANNEAFDLMCYADAAATKKGYDKINWLAPPPWARDWDNNTEIQADGVRSATRKSTATPPAERKRRRTRGRIG